ncbi:class I SAM-dependent methyltransferase [Mesobacillus subterraneus]|uniref:class I SAM-dependent methyltransferase n=1 Tax=Mesobacillus subterraneus TaxID=285983 RepID=UPI00273E28AB|nr:class I SAM-dependent methyltransferase [Mesobacillus subterraneus]WLR56640.1 class I SAM-dependent methyltransferase [Mesobacillus subterraneus]
MFVTTAGRTNEGMTANARAIACELEVDFVSRNKRSVSALQNIVKDDCLVVGKERLELFPLGASEPFFFHPNSAMFRVKRLMKGESDPLLDAGKLQEGKNFLDCSLGLGSDSIVASFIVGESGSVTGIEARQELAYLVKTGLKSWDSGYEALNNAMGKIKVINGYSLEFLKAQEDKSFDCVYFDPMFDESILESDGIRSLSHFAVYDGLTEEVIQQAIRVARERVVLKDHFKSKRFEEFGFNVYRRKSSKFHFGTIEKE